MELIKASLYPFTVQTFIIQTADGAIGLEMDFIERCIYCQAVILRGNVKPIGLTAAGRYTDRRKGIRIGMRKIAFDISAPERAVR